MPGHVPGILRGALPAKANGRDKPGHEKSLRIVARV